MNSPGLAAIVSKHFAPTVLICIVQVPEPSSFLVYVVVQESSNRVIMLYRDYIFIYNNMEFIYERENFVSSEFCTRIIDKFEKDDNKRIGRTSKGVEENYKKSTEIRLYRNEQWVDELNSFDEVLERAKNEYRAYIKQIDRNELIDMTLRMSHTYPPQIQRTLPGEFYHWHSDANIPTSFKTFTYILYLNDVDTENDGATEFSCGRCIQPKTGKLLIFPSTFTYLHRGQLLKNGVKYIATNGYVCLPPDVLAGLSR
jgi:hypothetical protein